MPIIAQVERFYDVVTQSFNVGPLLLISSFIMGGLIGSYLNVVIYRVPRGVSVNKPARSFCPGCKKQIPWYRNIPLFTWLSQRGKCAGCKGEIPIRYFIVELLTAVLFCAIAFYYPTFSLLLGWVIIALLVAISFIDGEHYVIPVHWCWITIPLAVIGSYFIGDLHRPNSEPSVGINALSLWISDITKISWSPQVANATSSFLGATLGYLGLALIVILGKILFGRKRSTFQTPQKWFLKEPETDDDQLQFIVGDEALDWGEVFYRKTDRIEITGEKFIIDGAQVSGEKLTIFEEEIRIGSDSYQIAELKSVEGQVSEVVIPREAMGGGDPPFLGMIGAFIGPAGVVFTLVASSFFGIAAAVLGRIGFGRPLPFGPFLALGAITWMLGGHKIFSLYLEMVFQ